MNWHQAELQHFGEEIRWLEPAIAEAAYVFACRFDSRGHLGLNPETVTTVERLEFDADVIRATSWLRQRLTEHTTLVVVFSEEECFRCRRTFFLDCWPDLFLPGRDDAIVYAERSEAILFVCHEGEFEFGRRKES